MAITARENWLRAVEFRYPEWIPCSVDFSPLTWRTLGADLQEIVRAFPRIFPQYQRTPPPLYREMPVVYRQGEYYRDHWGCLWYNQIEGLEGQVVEHPLADWSALATYRPPDLLHFTERGTRDWDEIAASVARQRAEGLLVTGDGERLFDRLYFLRGFEQLMMDIAEEPPELVQLIAMLEDYETRLIGKWLALGVDVIGFHTDIGTQRAPMISPAKFRKLIKPMFGRLFQACRRAGVHVALSSDGNLLSLVDDLIECGVSLHDPQLRANTLEGIVRAYRGKLCAKVDLDRQGFVFMTPAELREQVKQVVDAMALPEGGLMVLASIYDGNVTAQQIEALCCAMEEFCFP